ncbi:MAG: hypothetical protein RMJ56_00055 [Gemmataceae bacterium]|nr:hypothetical protein [Gemmata sp.]MDW8195973.1 hypothetical protein [Gemmataceae bacterium]
MLWGKTKSVRDRVLAIVFSTVGITFGVILVAAAGAAAGLWEWPPQPSSGFGVACGVLGGAIVVFEMLILPRKWLRSRRLGSTRVWMRWHVWMGLLALPVILLHAGFGWGGPLPATVMMLFLLVTASGIWGLIMQQWLPEKILHDIPGESIASQISRLGQYHAEEAGRLIATLVTVPPEAETSEPVVVGPLAAELVAFRDRELVPYLESGISSRSLLAIPSDAQQRFGRLREAVPPAARPVLDRLQELAELRRRWDEQERLHFWLHNWLLLHLPLSVTMTGLMLLHAYRALKFW